MAAPSVQKDLPSPGDLTYETVRDWAGKGLEEILQAPKGKALFLAFLRKCLACENLGFIEAVDDFEKTDDISSRKVKAQSIMKLYQTRLNIDPVLQQVGRWMFEKFLRKIHAEENLAFLDAVEEYQRLEPSQYKHSKAEGIFRQYLADNSPNQIHILASLRKEIENAISKPSAGDKQALGGPGENSRLHFEDGLFFEAYRGAMEHLRNDPYYRFLQSEEYRELLGLGEGRNTK